MRRDPDVGATWLYGYGRGQGVARERSAHERRENTGDLSIYNRTTHDAMSVRMSAAATVIRPTFNP